MNAEDMNKKTKVENEDSLNVEVPNEETIAAMEEGRRIASDPNIKGYASMEELKKALEE